MRGGGGSNATGLDSQGSAQTCFGGVAFAPGRMIETFPDHSARREEDTSSPHPLRAIELKVSRDITCELEGGVEADSTLAKAILAGSQHSELRTSGSDAWGEEGGLTHSPPPSRPRLLPTPNPSPAPRTHFRACLPRSRVHLGWAGERGSRIHPFRDQFWDFPCVPNLQLRPSAANRNLIGLCSSVVNDDAKRNLSSRIFALRRDTV